MRAFADLVREKGLKFGLWFEIERAAITAKNVAKNPQYYLTEDGNCFIDFANPEACEYIYQMVAEQIRLYGIEFIKFDFNAPITFDQNRHAFMEYFKGYRAVIDRMHAEFPSLYFENCASGGTRMALANLRGFDSFWMSDSHSLYMQLEIFKNTLLRMPCRALERWMTIQTLPNIKGRSREKIMVSDDAGWGLIEAVTDEFLRAATVGGPIGISCELTSFSETLRQSVSNHIAQYKAERAFWMNAECRILTDTPTMLVLQFSDASLSKIKIFGYAKDFIQTGITVYPVCQENTLYADANGVQRTGAELFDNGLEFAIEQRYRNNAFSAEINAIR